MNNVSLRAISPVLLDLERFIYICGKQYARTSAYIEERERERERERNGRAPVISAMAIKRRAMARLARLARRRTSF
jgi:hypothetical protein